MKVTAEKLPESQIRLNIEVEPEAVAKSVESAFRSIASRVDVPGFRRGKAPRHMIERLVGREAVVAEGIDRLLPTVYQQAVQETGIEPLDQPEFDVNPNFESATSEPLVFTATVPVQPTVTLGDYRSIRLAPVPVDVTPDMINRAIDAMRENAAVWTPVDRPSRAGDQLTLDLEGRIGTIPLLYSPEGQPIVSTSGGEVVFDLKNGPLIVDPQGGAPTPAVHQELVGLMPEREKAFQVTLPDDYSDRQLAGKSVTFKVKAHEVKEKHLPDLDDEFAKTVGEVETYQDLRTKLAQSLRERLEHDAMHHFEDSVVREVVERSTVEMPPILIGRELERLVHNFTDSLRQRGLTVEQYLRFAKQTDAELREELRPRALDNLKSYLVLREVGRAEGIDVAEADVETEIERLASVVEQQNAGRVREVLGRADERADIESNLRHRRVLDRLTAYARGEGAGESAPTEAAPVESGDVAVESDAIPERVAESPE